MRRRDKILAVAFAIGVVLDFAIYLWPGPKEPLHWQPTELEALSSIDDAGGFVATEAQVFSRIRPDGAPVLDVTFPGQGLLVMGEQLLSSEIAAGYLVKHAGSVAGPGYRFSGYDLTETGHHRLIELQGSAR